MPPDNTSDNSSFEERIGRVEQLIQKIEQSSDIAGREAAREVVAALLDLHRIGLSRIVSLVSQDHDDGRRMFSAWLADDLVRNLLLLHDLHPEDLETRVQQALQGVRSYLQSHGGNVELVEVTMDNVRLRMEGSCNGCPSSALMLKNTIEQAIYDAAPDVPGIEVEGLNEGITAPDLVQLEIVQPDNTTTGNIGRQHSSCCNNKHSLES